MALFIIALNLKQPRCPSTKKINKVIVVYLHNGVLFSGLKMASEIHRHMKATRKIILSEVTQKEKYGMYLLMSGYYLSNK